MSMQALILAAGRGSRMGKKTHELPKCLLEVGGRTLIEHQLETLADQGVGPVGIVVGYCADEIREVVGIRAEYILNSAWRRTNSLYSFWSAREWIHGPVMVLNSDLLYDPRIIAKLLEVKGDAFAFDSGAGDGAEQMKVQLSDGLLVGMSKELPAEDASGENVGILKFEERTARNLLQRAERIIEDGGENHWMSAAVSELAQEVPIKAVDVSGLPWGEIDFAYDLHRVRKDVWPAIRSGSRGHRRFAGLLQAAFTIAIAGFLAVVSNLIWASSREMTWETIELSDLMAVNIESPVRDQRWWRLDRSDSATFQLSGPTRLRLESRAVLPESTDLIRYALQVDVDGVPLAWDDHVGRPSQSWTFDGGRLAKHQKIAIEVAEGPHEIRLRMVGTDTQTCLIRASEWVPEPGED